MSEYTAKETGRAPSILPLIVTDEVVVFPQAIARLPLDEDAHLAANASMADGRYVLLATRRTDADTDTPLALQLHRVGVVARIEQAGKLPDGSDGLLVRGLVRALLDEQIQSTPFPRFAYTERPDVVESSPELDELITETRGAIDAVLDLRHDVPQDIRNFVRSIEHPGHLADTTGYAPEYTFQERQELLETFDVMSRLRKVRDFYRKQYTLLEVQQRLRREVQDGAEKQQREFFLRQQMRAIQKELGEDDAESAALDDLREKLAAATLPETVRKEADREMNRLERINSASPEYQMVRTYLEWIAELPWNKTTGSAIDVQYAGEVLDADHYGLDKIKERILEHLAVKQRLQSLAEDANQRTREPI
ncbi:MAG: ATP-dependent protease La Type I, partial [uncultured Chloroflexia bacterium]